MVKKSKYALTSDLRTLIFRFGFEGWIWVLIASVPGLCILFTFLHFIQLKI